MGSQKKVGKLVGIILLKLSCSYMVCCYLKNELTSRTLAVPVSFKFTIRESMAVVSIKLVVLRSCGKMEVSVGSVITTS